MSLLLAGCGVEDPTDSCPWYVRCGPGLDGADCGTCDDGDPCTADRCADGWCRHVPLADTCTCEASCQGADGRLVHIQTITHGDGGMPEPNGLLDAVLSADGRHVYAAARDSGAVAHFLDDDGWRFGESLPAGTVHALALADGLLVAAATTGITAYVPDADGRLVGPTMQGAPAQGIAAHGGVVVAVDGTHVLRFEVAGHVLEARGAVADPVLNGARRLALVDGRALVAGFDASTVSEWDVSGDTPTRVAVIADQPGLDNVADLAVSPDGSRVYTAGYCDHDLAVLDRTADGLAWLSSAYGESLGGCKLLPDHDDEDHDSAATRLLNPTAVALTPDGQTLLLSVPSPGFDVLAFSTAGDALTPLGFLLEQPEFDGVLNLSTEPLSQLDDPSALTFPEEYPYSVALATGTDRVVATSLWAGALAILDGIDADAFVQRGQGGVRSLLGAYNLEASPDGRHLYVAPRLVGTVRPFAIDATTGGLTEVPEPTAPSFGDQTGAVSNLDVTPTGDQVFAIDSMYAKVLVYDRDADTGALTLGSHHDLPDCAGNPSFPVDIAVSPDGNSVFVADFQYGPSCMVVFERADGTLGDPVQYDEANLAGVENIAFTADGRNVYAAAYGNKGAVAHYTRDPQTGALTANEGVEGGNLNGAEFTILSPDERFLFVASPVSDAVMSFSRRDDGSLKLADTVEDQQQGAKLEGAAGLAVSADGTLLYVAARAADAINHFAVDDDGDLTLKSVVTVPGLDWVNGLELVNGVLYAAAVDASAVTVWRVARGDGDGCLGTCP